MTMLSFTVHGEPRGKGRPRFVSTPQGGRAYTDAQTVAYERTIAWMAKQAGAVVVDGPLKLNVTAYLQIPRSASKKRQVEMLAGRELPTKKPDADNLLKALSDGLNGIAFKDDSQIVELSIRKLWSNDPRLEVQVSPVSGVNEQSDGVLRNKAA